MSELPGELVDALIADPVTREAIKDVTIELLTLKLHNAESENAKLSAQLAAVPVEELRRLFSGELSYMAHRECMEKVEAWIDAQEVQP